MLQGDTLSPFLFVNALDYAMRKALGDDEKDLGFTITPRRSRRHSKEVLSDLDFADDIALLSDAIAQAQELLSRVETECKKVGLGLNGPKTKKTLVANCDSFSQVQSVKSKLLTMFAMNLLSQQSTSFAGTPSLS